VTRSAASAVACLALLLACAPAALANSNITVVAGSGVVNNTGAPTFTPTGPDSQIGVDQINAQLAAGLDVTLDTSTPPLIAAQPGTITVNAAVGSVSDADLILDADSLVDLNADVNLINGGAPLSITAVGSVDLDDVISGSLSVNAGDPVSQSGSATVAGNAHFVTNTFDAVTLTNGSNDFNSLSTGIVSTLSVTDESGIALGDLFTNGAFLLNAGGSVTQVPSSAAVIGGATQISVGTTNDVTLTNAGNDFSAVSFPSADNVSVVDSSLLTLSASAINGNLFATTSGLLDQDAALDVAGATTLAAGAGNDILLDNSANDWSTVAITSADDASIRDANALALGATALGDDLIVGATGALTQTGGASVPGETTATGAPVTFDHGANDFGGAVAMTSSGSNAAAVTDADDLTLDSSSAGGALTTTAGDDLTVPAGETVAATGELRLVADNGNPNAPAIGTGGITLGSGAALTGSGAIRLYAARRGDNSIAFNATINGSTFSPGTLFDHSARERWGVYAPGGTATTPFTFFYKDRDTSAPRAEITSPTDGATYERNEVVTAAYSCTDGLGGGTGVTKCEGTVRNGRAIDTATLGQHEFEVEVENGAGNRNRVTVSYTVVDSTPPTVRINAPLDGAIYALGQRVSADYRCADETALVACGGTVPSGAAIDTSSLGRKTFTAGAIDGSGNATRVTVTYVVVNPTGACALKQNGTRLADVLTGTVDGDALFGGAGPDRISGKADDDCLHGGAGKDRLLGRAGRDRLWGGTGADLLKGGAGRNRYSGQRGNDELRARNDRADVVRCGRGADVAIVDERDRTRRCEIIRVG
jgi:Repeats of unknown function (DUF5649)/RTX calcium-binding nonapeptide repeat (4 copies)